MSRYSDSTRAEARTITIAVTFFADLRRFLPRGAEGPQRYTVPEGATAADLLAAIGVEANAEVTIAVDGELASRETPLRDGSDVMLLNPMEGGAAAAGEATNQNIGGAAAAGEATNQNIGGAAAGWRSRSRRRGDQQDGEATTKMEGG
jgi:sulfur carrier protein ThiS